jgi:hypothetical protein
MEHIHTNIRKPHTTQETVQTLLHTEPEVSFQCLKHPAIYTVLLLYELSPHNHTLVLQR